MLYEGKEVFFGHNDLTVCKTDFTGKLIYTNYIFLNIADYHEQDVIGKMTRSDNPSLGGRSIKGMTTPYKNRQK